RTLCVANHSPFFPLSLSSKTTICHNSLRYAPLNPKGHRSFSLSKSDFVFMIVDRFIISNFLLVFAFPIFILAEAHQIAELAKKYLRSIAIFYDSLRLLALCFLKLSINQL